MDLGEYQAVDKLPTSPLSASQRAAVRWLIEHPSRTIAPDSNVLVAFARTSADGYVGALRIRVDGYPVVAMLSPRAGCGLRLSDTSSVVRKLRRYPADSIGASRFVPAIADSIGYGRMTVTNVPAEVTALRDAQAVLCIGALARFAPTFDPKAGLATLRVGGPRRSRRRRARRSR